MPGVMDAGRAGASAAAALALGLSLGAASARPAAALPSYRYRVPNGERVPCDEALGMSGCRPGEFEAHSINGPAPPQVCKGLGHNTCDGGNFPLNPFGVDFKLEGFKWTEDLCKKDSDGDGLTNGEELGDPCCVWEFESLPLPNFATHDVSHPGVAASVSATKRTTSCSGARKPGPATTKPQDGFFNPGEEGKTVDMMINGFKVPSRHRTTYVTFAVDFDAPECIDNTCYMVGIEAIVDKRFLLHHYVVDACTKRWPEDKRGEKVGYKSHGGDLADCDIHVGLWAPGADPMFEAPGVAGIPFGGDVGYTFRGFFLQMHYDNPGGVTGEVDRSGIRVHYVTAPRQQHGLGWISAAELNNLPNRIAAIPPKQERYHISRVCTVTGLEEPASISAIWFHGHQLVREFQTELYRRGQRSVLWKETSWHFGDQFHYTLEAANLKVYNGDVFVSSCVYNSTERDTTTNIYFATTDEMCFSHLQYYPHAGKGAQCDGQYDHRIVFHGPLEKDEDLRDVYTRHAPKDYVAESLLGFKSQAPEDEAWSWDTATLRRLGRRGGRRAARGAARAGAERARALRDAARASAGAGGGRRGQGQVEASRVKAGRRHAAGGAMSAGREAGIEAARRR